MDNVPPVDVADAKSDRMPSVMEVYFARLLKGGDGGPIGELAVMLSQGVVAPSAFTAHVKRHGLARENWFRLQVLDLALGFIRDGIEDSALRSGHLSDVRTLKAFLHIADGDFYAYRASEVAAIIGEQLDRILDDAEITDEEELRQVDLQAAFGLAYDEYLALGRSAFERTFHDLQRQMASGGHDSREASRKLRALEPIYQLACVGRRSLGARY
jgi:hypothetical protein